MISVRLRLINWNGGFLAVSVPEGEPWTGQTRAAIEANIDHIQTTARLLGVVREIGLGRASSDAIRDEVEGPEFSK